MSLALAGRSMRPIWWDLIWLVGTYCIASSRTGTPALASHVQEPSTRWRSALVTGRPPSRTLHKLPNAKGDAQTAISFGDGLRKIFIGTYTHSWRGIPTFPETLMKMYYIKCKFCCGPDVKSLTPPQAPFHIVVAPFSATLVLQPLQLWCKSLSSWHKLFHKNVIPTSLCINIYKHCMKTFATKLKY